MKNALLKILHNLYVFIAGNNNNISVEGTFSYPSSTKISNSTIKVGKGASLKLGEHVQISGYNLIIEKGDVFIGENSRLEKGANPNKPSISLLDGTLTIGKNTILRSDFSIRFGGKCNIGDYTGIMENTEIRCDESLEIGDFNMISYECMIYDTNTHCIYPSEIRREMTLRDFPYMGAEYEKPSTQALKIGNDCWIGKRACLLKGVQVGNGSTIASCAVVTKNVPDNHLAFGNPAQMKSKLV